MSSLSDNFRKVLQKLHKICSLVFHLMQKHLFKQFRLGLSIISQKSCCKAHPLYNWQQQILSTLPKGKNSCPFPWIASSTANSYCNGYTDHEESENEKRRKTCHSWFSLHSPTHSLKHDNEACRGGFPVKLIVVKCYTVILDGVLSRS